MGILYAFSNTNTVHLKFSPKYLFSLWSSSYGKYKVSSILLCEHITSSHWWCHLERCCITNRQEWCKKKEELQDRWYYKWMNRMKTDWGGGIIISQDYSKKHPISLQTAVSALSCLLTDLRCNILPSEWPAHAENCQPATMWKGNSVSVGIVW